MLPCTEHEGSEQMLMYLLAEETKSFKHTAHSVEVIHHIFLAFSPFCILFQELFFIPFLYSHHVTEL